MRTRTLTVAALMFLGMKTPTFGQAIFSVGCIPVATATASGNTERTGNIRLTMIQGSGATAPGSITINYGLPITATKYGIVISGDGGFSSALPTLTGPFYSSGELDGIKGKIELSVPGGVSSGSFTVSGVRVPLAGVPLSSLSAGVSSSGNAIVAGQTGVTVINSFAPGLASAGASPGARGIIDGVTGQVLDQPVASVREDYLAAFVPQGPDTTTSVMVRFWLSTAPPPGVIITFPTTADLGSSTWNLTDSDGVSLGAPLAITNSSTNLLVYYRVVSGTDPTLLETLAIPIILCVSPSATLPLPATTISYTCTLAPVRPAFNPNGTAFGLPIPRFAAAETGPATLFEIKVRNPDLTTDMDGDGKSDIAVWRPASGIWYIIPSGAPETFISIQWGLPTDTPVTGDYDGDGKTDIAVWRPTSGTWFVLPSNSPPGTYTAQQWGIPTDKPVPGDYDGDGKTDIAVWRPASGIWYIIPSGAPETFISTQWGVSTDIPVPGDYDGDGKTDIVVWRPSAGVWYALLSSAPGIPFSTQWGVSTDIPVPGDYDGDGKTDIVVWRPSTGVWHALLSSAPGIPLSRQWGMSTDIPVVGDYDGSGMTTIGVWRPSSGIWYIIKSTDPENYMSTQWGVPTDVPLSPLTRVLRSIE